MTLCSSELANFQRSAAPRRTLTFAARKYWSPTVIVDPVRSRFVLPEGRLIVTARPSSSSPVSGTVNRGVTFRCLRVVWISAASGRYRSAGRGHRGIGREEHDHDAHDARVQPGVVVDRRQAQLLAGGDRYPDALRSALIAMGPGWCRIGLTL